MYVCIEVAFHGSAHGIRRPTGPGVGDHQKVGPMSQLRGTIDTVSHTLIRTNADVRFLNQIHCRQLRVTCTLIFRGAVSHQARAAKGCFFVCSII